MKVRLLETITLRSEPLSAGRELELSEQDASQLIAAGHAEAVSTPEPEAIPRNAKPTSKE